MPQALALSQVDNVSKNTDSDFYEHVISGLSGENKRLSPKYFYDEQGSKYFDQICELEEYYPYKTELRLLPRVAKDMAELFLKPLSIVEFGAGSLLKIQPLFDEISHVREFIPIDISGEHLHQACRELKRQFPDIIIDPREGDFCNPVNLAPFRGQRLGFFPGSTIGNFSPEQAVDFLKSARQTLGKDSYMLVGVDTKKTPDLLHRAYNDKLGVTAKFNKNILHRINREMDANIETENFDHYAFYNAKKGRIEMHLVSKVHQDIEILGNQISFRTGESIHTECSYKYSPEDFSELVGKTGWNVASSWMADKSMFSMFLLHANSLTS